MMERALVILSGGMDSSTAAFVAAKDFIVETLFFDYGQRALERELNSFTAISKRLSAKEHIIELPFLKELGGSALTNENIPIPDSDNNRGIPPTYVPFRNGILLSVAAALAEIEDIHHLFIGAVWEDSSGYPDCRPDFLSAMEKTVNLGRKPESHLTIQAPLLHLSKAEIIRRGLKLGVPYELTWSCYYGGAKPCGTCPSCRLRLQAFERLGIPDPLTPLRLSL